jgi:hypothetical protein
LAYVYFAAIGSRQRIILQRNIKFESVKIKDCAIESFSGRINWHNTSVTFIVHLSREICIENGWFISISVKRDGVVEFVELYFIIGRKGRSISGATGRKAWT